MRSLSEICNVLEFQNWSQVSHFVVKGLVSILLDREILIKFHSNFIAKKSVFGAFYCRMEPVLFQDLFISILLGISF